MSRIYRALLAVEENATSDEVRRAQRRLAAIVHPDAHGGSPHANSAMRVINDAVEVLVDPEMRAAYDEFGELAFDPGFDAERVRAALGAGPRPVDTTVNVILPRAELVTGTVCGVPVPALIPCELCGGCGEMPWRCNACRGASWVFANLPSPCVGCQGTGLVPFTPSRRCSLCGGSGSVEIPTLVKCDACGGTGAFRAHCSLCEGRGEVHRFVAQRVRVPPGVHHGSMLRVAGGVPAGTVSSEPTDLYIRILVATGGD